MIRGVLEPAGPEVRFDIDQTLHPGAMLGPAHFRLKAAWEAVARRWGLILQITAGTNGQHSGPDDPHTWGNAFDVRAHTLTEANKPLVLQAVLKELSDSPTDDPVLPNGDQGYCTKLFYAFLEDPATPQEHFHSQLRHGRDYTAVLSPGPVTT